MSIVESLTRVGFVCVCVCVCALSFAVCVMWCVQGKRSRRSWRELVRRNGEREGRPKKAVERRG